MTYATPNYKVILVGSPTAGKTTFCKKLMNGGKPLTDAATPTTGMNAYVYEHHLDERVTTYLLMDMSGYRSNFPIVAEMLKVANAVILFLDPTKAIEVLPHYIDGWFSTIRRRNKACPVYMVRSKEDLVAAEQRHILSTIRYSPELTDLGYISPLQDTEPQRHFDTITRRFRKKQHGLWRWLRAALSL